MEENKQKNKITKEFGLTSLSLNNSATVMVMTLIIAIAGIYQYVNLPKENFPEVEMPTIYVGTIYSGNSPADIENLITRPLEKEINTVENIDNIKSTSVQGYSTIIIEFVTGTDVKDALVKVKDAVDKARSELPTDLKFEPDVFELNFSEFPILNINLSGDYPMVQLNEYAEYLEDEIEKFREISKVEIRGVGEREVKINCNPYLMAARMVSFGDIEMAVANENVNISGGDALSDGVRRNIRILGEFSEPENLLDVVVKAENGNIVYLRDVATVEFDYKDPESFARLGEESVVMVDVVKRSGENLLAATEKINKVLAYAQKNVFPEDLNIVMTGDQSKETRTQVNSLENNIISGVILVVLVLLFFLGTRNALFVGMAIPLSMFLSFLILGIMGVTINMIVLFSLIMALGMLVDNGIVVVENVYRMMEEGLQPFDAAKKGVGEVALPIISSTATTLAAFLPLAFWPGMMGEFMKYLPITLMITLGSSLFVALVINPVFIAHFMKVQGEGMQLNYRKVNFWGVGLIVAGLAVFALKMVAMHGSDADGKFFNTLGNLLGMAGGVLLLNVYVLTPLSERFQAIFLPWLENLYEGTLRKAVTGRGPYAFFFGTVGMLIFSFALMGVFTPNVEFFPTGDPKYVNVFIEYPVGTDIETTNVTGKKIEKQVAALVKPYGAIVESIISNVGEGTSDPGEMSVGGASTPHKARITINFVDFADRGGVSTRTIMNDIRDGIDGAPGVSITVDQDQNGPPTGKPISIEISGPKFEKLIGLSDDLTNEIATAGIMGIEKLKSDLERGKPELLVNIDREKARRFGLSTVSIASEIRTALFGKEISKYKQGEDDYEIQLRLDKNYRYDIEALMNQNITFRNQSDGKIRQVPISAVATIELSSTYGSIKRKDLDRVVTLSSNVLDGYNATKINDQIRALVADMYIPEGYEVKFGGEQEKQAEEMGFLSGALMIAVFMIFLIIVAQFNQVTAPFIIITSVVFSTIGVFLGLVVFQMDFIIIMTMIGIISLAGIVVNNAIVLIDFIGLKKQERLIGLKEGESLRSDQLREAVVEAGKTRLRPVLLTAITTVLGLIPLAVGINIDFLGWISNFNADFYIGGDNVIFWGPMSWTIIFGLTFATFLTLVIVPVMYIIIEDIKLKLKSTVY
ncbi:efflux RND transporter permease subunit [Persicobacter diffluens]|uniref:Copper transporter n=1 Tax=Persicobacter diffluens TaxID=981 RepID=A0AAN5ALQ1_9BACT|nr:copper transporter [Persicobacter diffluens]